MKIIYVTGNNLKFEILKKSFEGSHINLIQKQLDTPEIQSVDVRDVAIYSAKWASKKLNSAVIVTDAGFYINSLKGFPGPYIKYINNWLSSEEILRMLEDKDDRGICIRECLAYCSKDGEVKTFEHEIKGEITKKVKYKKGSSIDRIVIPKGLNCTLSELTQEEAVIFWSRNSNDKSFRKWIEQEKI